MVCSVLACAKLDHGTAGMAEFEVPVTQCEVWAVTTAFDTDSSGQVKKTL